MLWPLLTVLLGGSPAGAVPTEVPTLLGHWELSRFDDIPAPEAPPGGPVNTQVVFKERGVLQVFSPRSPEPFDGTYELRGSRFRGWLGLTNGVAGHGRLEWATPDRFDLTYPDGSVASFRRLSKTASMPARPVFRCVPMTIRGRNYDARRVANAKRLADQLTTAAPPTGLLGNWSVTFEERTARISIHMTFGKDGIAKQCVVRESAVLPRSARASQATFSVLEGHLLTSVLKCGDPAPFQLDGSELVLLDTEDLTFRRQDGSVGLAEACK